MQLTKVEITQSYDPLNQPWFRVDDLVESDVNLVASLLTRFSGVKLHVEVLTEEIRIVRTDPTQDYKHLLELIDIAYYIDDGVFLLLYVDEEPELELSPCDTPSVPKVEMSKVPTINDAAFTLKPIRVSELTKNNAWNLSPDYESIQLSLKNIEVGVPGKLNVDVYGITQEQAHELRDLINTQFNVDLKLSTGVDTHTFVEVPSDLAFKFKHILVGKYGNFMFHADIHND